MALSSLNEDETSTSPPFVSFGLISDIQYADHDDCWNFVKTDLRRYRNAAKLTEEACEYWSRSAQPISFILQLGDLIDGVAAKNHNSQTDLNRIIGCFRKTFPTLPIYHIWGNHELYNFTREELLNGPLCSFETKDIRPAHYGSFEVCPHLRIIALDTYEFSALGVEETSDIYQKSMELLRKYNQNESPNDPTNLRGHQRRFVQFNGGILPQQLHWLEEQLNDAKSHDDKVMIIGHIPIHPSACDHLDLLWNYKEVLDVLWKFEGIVLAYLAGHDHRGGYFRDRKNIHHLTLNSVIECEPNTNSFATVHVSKESILITGVGLIDRKRKRIMRLYNRVVLMHRKQIYQPWLSQGRTMLNYALEHIPHVVWGIPFAALFMVLIGTREIYKANAYQFNVYKRRLMIRRPEEIPVEYRPFCS